LHPALGWPAQGERPLVAVAAMKWTFLCANVDGENKNSIILFSE